MELTTTGARTYLKQLLNTEVAVFLRLRIWDF